MDFLFILKISTSKVEIALKTDPANAELLKLKEDLVVSRLFKLSFTNKQITKLIILFKPKKEIISLTKELIEEDSGKSDKTKITSGQSWKQGDKCMAIWRVDGKLVTVSK